LTDGGDDGRGAAGRDGGSSQLDETATARPDPSSLLASQDADFPPGSRLGRFIVLARLGAGGMGVVLAAHDPELDRKVAIKVLRPQATARGQPGKSQQILLREAQALARLSHPNVITVYEVGAFDEHVFLAMEHVDGATLTRWLAGSARAWREILRVFIEAGRGLAAAHRAGLVHRDFKPSNVLIGKDRRVQVTDFGVATTVGGLASAGGGDDAEPAGRSLLGITVGDTGDAVGTLQFMAPEQHTSGPVDNRTDQFAFCVALYLALYGEHPFEVADFTELRASVCAGRVRAARTASAVPSAVRAVLLRGLRPQPADRHPSMDALLAELEPQVTSGWWRHRVAATLALVAIASVLSVTAVGAWRHHGERVVARAREDAAQASLRALRERVEPLLQEGRSADVDTAFEAFLQIDDFRGSNAVAQAWLERAAWMHRQGRRGDELAAWAAAWAASPTQALQAQALLGLAHAFRRRWEWGRLETVLDRLDKGFHRGPDDPELASLRVSERLAHRDLPGAVELLRGHTPAPDPDGYDPVGAAPALSALAHATPTSIDAVSVTATRFRGAPALFVLADGGRKVELLREDAALTPIVILPLPGDALARAAFPLPVAPDRFFVLAMKDTGTGDVAVLYRLADELVVEQEWPDYSVLAADTFDVDRDGRDDIVIGTGPYARRVLQLQQTSSGWRFDDAYPDLAGSSSDVLALHDADLDGDGDAEAFMALGPWKQFEVRVARRTSHGLVTAGRRKLGVVDDVAVLHTRDGVRLAAAKSDVSPSRKAFPAGDHYGEPAGIILLRWDGNDLVRAGGIAVRPPEGGARQFVVTPLGTPLIAADLDGDGLEDLITAVEPRDRPYHMLLARQRPDGGLAPVLVGDVRVLAAAELDGDPGAELLVELPPSRRLWVLGLGDGHLPVVAPPAIGPAAPVPSASSDPLLARTWARAEDLATMGLADEAAKVIDRIADLGGPLGKRARLRAAALHEAMRDLDGAADRFEAAAAEDLDAGLRAARLRARYFDFVAADRLAGAVARRTEASPAQRAEARLLVDRIAPLLAIPPLELSFAGPLAPGWRILAPEALRRDLATGSLHVDAFPSDRSILELPVTRVGDWIRISVDLDVEHTDLGTGLEVALVDPAVPGSHLGVVVQAQGGGLLLRRLHACSLPAEGYPTGGSLEELESPDDPAQLTLSVDYLAGESVAWCSITDRRGHVLSRGHLIGIKPPAGAGLVLVVGHGGAVRLTDGLGAFTQRASMRIERIEVRGLRAAETPPTPLQRAHHQLVDGDALGAIASYDAAPASADPSWRVGRALALTSLGRDSEAVDELRPAWSRPDVGRAVWQIIFIHHTPFAVALLNALGSRSIAGLPWWMAFFEHLDDPHISDLVAHLPDASIKSLVTPSSRHAIVLALFTRGKARWRSGKVAAARADLERALKIGGPQLVAQSTDDPPQPDAEEVASALAQLAVVCSAEGDERAALAYAREAVAMAPFPDFIRYSLATEPTLAVRRGQAGWQDILP